MRTFIISAVAVLSFSVSAWAQDLTGLVGAYEMKWGNGKIGVYTINAISETTADVTYSYGNKSETKTLKVKNGTIKGGGWFPTFKVGSSGGLSATHSGNPAKVKKQ